MFVQVMGVIFYIVLAIGSVVGVVVLYEWQRVFLGIHWRPIP